MINNNPKHLQYESVIIAHETYHVMLTTDSCHSYVENGVLSFSL